MHRPARLLLLALSVSRWWPHGASGLPAPQLGHGGEKSGAVGGVHYPTPHVTAPNGSLRAGPELLGGNAPRPDPNQADSAVVPDPQLVEGQEADGKLGLYLDLDGANPPQPLRGGYGATDPGPRTYEYEKLNPDLYAPPSTDAGTVANAMWPMGLSRNRLGTGKEAGWAREQNKAVLPAATAMAGVEMRLAPHAYRELHWHTAGEWALVLKGSVRVTAVDEESRGCVDDLTAGDVWFFPQGVPHSVQALAEGAEFLLVFDDGAFSEESTFLLSETLLRNPVEVLSKNMGADASAFARIPQSQLFIFNGTPAPTNLSAVAAAASAAAGPLAGASAFTYHWSRQKPYEVPGGSVKIVDPVSFPAAAGFSAALVVVQAGAMREMHWHPTSDEWSFFLQGRGRTTVFAAPASSRTFDFSAGDVGYIAASNGHYVENTGEEDLIFLEVLQAPKFSDISVNQWLALTPKQVVKDHTNLADGVIDSLPREKQMIVAGKTNRTGLAGKRTTFGT